MTSNPIFTACFQAPKTPQQREEEFRSHEKRRDVVSTLPLEEGWSHIPLRRYQGVWYPEAVLPGVIALQEQFNPDPTDVILATYPKSGTTWLKALVFAISVRGQGHRPCSPQHPLVHRHPQECSANLEGLLSIGQLPDFDALGSPRVLGTHVAYSCLPDSIRTSGCRILYLCRDPKDTLVSLWHFSEGIVGPEVTEPKPVAGAIELFCAGRASYGLVWEHMLGYWEESLRRPGEVMFLRYEEMMEEPAGYVRRVAGFMGMPFSEEEEREGMVEEIVSLCSFERLRGLEVNKVGFIGEDLGWNLKRSSYFRKGKVGDWREHLSLEMAERIDRITQQKLDGSGLTFKDR